MTAHTKDAEARREARRERLRRARKRARLRLTLVITILVVAALATAAWFAVPKGPRTAPTPKSLGALTFVRVRTRIDPIDLATATLKAYVVEISKPKGPVLPPPMDPAPGVRTIVVEKKTQLVTLFEADGTPIDLFQCATGRTLPYPGTYKVSSRRQQGTYLGDRSRFFHFVIFTKAPNGNNIGFHSIPIDTKGDPIGGLGKAISHGCVRLANEKAEFVYDWAKNGTKVIVRK